jgi:hypothetical protein
LVGDVGHGCVGLRLRHRRPARDGRGIGLVVREAVSRPRDFARELDCRRAPDAGRIDPGLEKWITDRGEESAALEIKVVAGIARLNCEILDAAFAGRLDDKVSTISYFELT